MYSQFTVLLTIIHSIMHVCVCTCVCVCVAMVELTNLLSTRRNSNLSFMEVHFRDEEKEKWSQHTYMHVGKIKEKTIVTKKKAITN